MFNVEPVTSSKPTDCGATCMKMLLAYYGDDVDLDVLINECKTGVTGCTAKDLRRVGNNHGLDMKAYSMDAEETMRQDRPSIVWWKYNHFCICCGMDDDGNVIICNPDRGRYRMSKGIFKSFYSGVSLFNGEPTDLPEEEPVEE